MTAATATISGRHAGDSRPAVPVTPDRCGGDEEDGGGGAEERNRGASESNKVFDSGDGKGAKPLVRHCDDAECVRLLTRQLRQTGENAANANVTAALPSSSSNTKTTRSASPNMLLQEQLVRAADGAPDWIQLQNAVWQLQHALTLAQAEAAAALQDAAVQQARAVQWEAHGAAAVARHTRLAAAHEALAQRTHRLAQQRRVLTAAYRRLAADQFATDAHRVECYVVHALAWHEQCLTSPGGGGSSSSASTATTTKNRSRTSTMETIADYSTCSHCCGSSSSSGALLHPEPTPRSPVDNVVADVGDEEEPAVVVEAQITPVKNPHRHLGFGAVGAMGLGKTFHLHKKKEQQRKDGVAAVAEGPQQKATPAKVAVPAEGPYVPVRLELLEAGSHRTSGDKAGEYCCVTPATEAPKQPRRQHANFFFSTPRPDRTAVALPPRPLISLADDDSLPRPACSAAGAESHRPLSATPTPHLPRDVTFALRPSRHHDSHSHSSPLRDFGESPLRNAAVSSSSSSSSLWNDDLLSACDPAMLRSLSIPIVHEMVGDAVETDREEVHPPSSSSSRAGLRRSKRIELRAARQANEKK